MIDNQPLLGLEAVVLDTETTGLDPAKARILQIGAVYLRHGQVLAEPVFVTRVNPGVPVPPETTRIHGLDAAALAGAPGFADIHAGLTEFLGNRLILGHNIGFDIALLDRECALAGLPEFGNRLLDTRLLGELCFQHLGGFSLDKLASHLGVSVVDRHDALADAQLTARVFLALLAPLRQHHIRTLNEAEVACRRLTAVLDDYNRAGWSEPVRRSEPAGGALGRIDAFPFRHRAGDVASMPPVHIGPDVHLGEAISLMRREGISSVFVSGVAEQLQEPVGIITERDVIRHIGEHGASALGMPASAVASRPLQTVPADAFIYRAIGRMDRLNVRHLAIVDERGVIIGALSARDLLRLRASDALALGDAIEDARTAGELAGAWARIPKVAHRLLEEGITTAEVAAVISDEICALTRAAARSAEEAMLAEGHGPAPGAYAVLVLGSGGRGESLLIPDQDNAIIFVPEGEPAQARAWFLQLGKIMNGMLDDIGIPLCKGGVMAGNPSWSGTPDDWRQRLQGWTETVDPADLLSVDIFFDFRAVAGDVMIAEALRSEAKAIVKSSLPLIKLLANQLEQWSPPLGFLGRLLTTDGRIDLKKGGLFPIVAAARCLALGHGIDARGTVDRIAALRALEIGADSDLEMLEAAHARLAGLILRQQLEDIRQGRPLSTLVDTRRLPQAELAGLKRCLSALQAVPTMVHDLLFARQHPRI